MFFKCLLFSRLFYLKIIIINVLILSNWYLYLLHVVTYLFRTKIRLEWTRIMCKKKGVIFSIPHVFSTHYILVSHWVLWNIMIVLWDFLCNIKVLTWLAFLITSAGLPCMERWSRTAWVAVSNMRGRARCTAYSLQRGLAASTVDIHELMLIQRSSINKYMYL